jgi:hypothetical protein
VPALMITHVLAFHLLARRFRPADSVAGAAA